MSADTMVCRDLFMRHTDTNGHSWVQCHRVWNAQRFIAAQAAAAAQLNAAVKGDAPRLAKAEQITEEAYRKEGKKQ